MESLIYSVWTFKKKNVFRSLSFSDSLSPFFSTLAFFFLPFCFIKTLKNDKQNSGKAKWKPSCALSLYLSYPFFSFVLLSTFYFCSIHFISLTWDEEKWRMCDAEECLSLYLLRSLLFSLSWFFLCFSLSFDQKCKLIQTDSKPRRVQKSFPLSNFLYFLSLYVTSISHVGGFKVMKGRWPKCKSVFLLSLHLFSLLTLHLLFARFDPAGALRMIDAGP